VVSHALTVNTSGAKEAVNTSTELTRPESGFAIVKVGRSGGPSGLWGAIRLGHDGTISAG